MTLDTAEQILKDASIAIRRAGKVHGDTYKSFQMVADMWTVYVRHVMPLRGSLQPRDVAAMMSLLKKVRAVYGSSRDHYIDDAGYTALAAMVAPTKE